VENGSQVQKNWHALTDLVSLSSTAHAYWYFMVISCDGLYVANCGHPTINDLIRIVDHDENDLSTEQGTTINFTCPPSMSFTGQNSITCMENGEWHPHPNTILCEKG
jgi:hypothetical protein